MGTDVGLTLFARGEAGLKGDRGMNPSACSVVCPDSRHTLHRSRVHRGCWRLLVLAWGCGGALICASATAQSLADVARAEAERRKAITRPSRVYTNKDLKPARSSVPPSEAGAPAGMAAHPSPRVRGDEFRSEVPLAPGGAVQREATASADAIADADADAVAGPNAEDRDRRSDDEQRWRSRMAAARAQVDRSRTLAEALQSRINALTADFSARDDPAQRAVVGEQLNKALAELDRISGDIEVQQKQVTDLEEEARRAGVPPGWVR